MKPPRPAFVFLAVSLAAGAAAADWAPNLAAAATWDDNATNANRAGDRLGALRLDVTLAGGQRTGLTRELALLYGAQLDAEAWPRFDSLNRIAAGPMMALQYKGGLGPLAPTFTLRAAATMAAAQDNDRAGPEGRLSFGYGQRLNVTTRLAAGVTATRFDAREAIYARTGIEEYVECSFDFDANWRLLLAVRCRQGDVLSYATPPRPDLFFLSREVAPSDAYGRPMIAYCLEAHTVGGAVTLSRALGESTSLNLSLGWCESVRSPLTYVNRLVSLGVTRQF